MCGLLSSNLGLGGLWWLVGLLQLSALLPLLLLHRLCRLLPVLSFITISKYVPTSFVRLYTTVELHIPFCAVS